MIWILGAAEPSGPCHNWADVIPMKTHGGGEEEDASNV